MCIAEIEDEERQVEDEQGIKDNVFQAQSLPGFYGMINSIEDADHEDKTGDTCLVQDGDVIVVRRSVIGSDVISLQVIDMKFQYLASPSAAQVFSTTL